MRMIEEGRILEVEVWAAALGNRRPVVEGRLAQRSISVMVKVEYTQAVVSRESQVLRHEGSWVVLDMTAMPILEAVAAQAAILAHSDTPALVHVLLFAAKLAPVASVALSYCLIPA